MADPYWERFCTPLARRIAALIAESAGGARGTTPEGAYILEEPIDAVLGDGRYQIGADALRVKGQALLKVGQRVHVLWKRGRRAVILTHQWRRTQGGTWDIPPGGGVVEALLIADGAVYFRNAEQVTDLGLAGDWDAAPVFVRWGHDGASFVVLTARTTCYVYELDRGDAERTYGTTPPTATLLATHEPLDDGLVLYAQSETTTLSGETRYFGQTDWGYPAATWADPTTFLGVIEEIPISRVLSRTGAIVLTRAAVEGTATPNRAPTILLTDLQLDAARHVILALAVNVLAQTPPSVSNASSRNIWTDRPTPAPHVAGTAFNDPPILSVGAWFNHAILVDVTAGAVLWRTCQPTVRHEVAGEEHRFHTVKLASGSETDYGATWRTDPATDSSQQVWSAPAGGETLAASFADVLSGFGTEGGALAGVSGYSFDEYAPDLTYLDTSDLFVTDTSPLTVLNGMRWIADGGFASSPTHFIEVQRRRVRIWQRKRFAFAATYWPAAPRADGTIPLGVVFLNVREETRTSFSGPYSSARQGLYLHDLDAGTVLPIVPLAANNASTQGVHLPMLTPARFFFHLVPATEQTFTVLGFDGHHVLWLERHGDDTAAVKLAQIAGGALGPAATVLAGPGMVAGGGLDGADGLSPELLDLLAMNLQVLRPGETYFPSDDPAMSTEDKRNQFIAAWDETGAPTLDATAPDFPPLAEPLKDLGAQKDLDAVVPLDDTPLAVNGGPINLVLGETGASWHIVPTEALTTEAR